MPNAPVGKDEVRSYWNQQSCGAEVALAPKFTREYFEQIESFRYRDQPFIHAFAQFTRYQGKKVLEVGFGCGTDFLQWLRAGAVATGIDLTQEGLENLSHRIEIYGPTLPESISIGDAENLPFGSNTFDLGYSFGVLHHSPDTPQAVAELTRVVRPGGEIKIMLYNKHSVYVINQWIKHALLKGRPWKTPSWVLWHHMESPGTKSYTRGELLDMLRPLPLENIQIHTEVTSADYLSGSVFPPLVWLNRFILRAGGCRHDWLNIEYTERGSRPQGAHKNAQTRFTGNRFGFFHCISAQKKAD